MRRKLPEGFIRCKKCKRPVADEVVAKLKHVASFHQINYALSCLAAQFDPRLPPAIKTRLVNIQFGGFGW